MRSDLLRRRAALTPDAIAVEGPGIRSSYRALDAEADAVAAGLRAAGVARGSIVAALLPVARAGVAAVHGVPRAGAALAPAGVGWTRGERERFVDGLRPAAWLAPLASPASDGPPPGEPVGGSAGRILAAAGLRLHRVGPGRPSLPSGTHSVLWTSGTGGTPRAVPLTLANHLAVARGAARRLGLGATDRWLASLALSHVGGLALILRAAYTGARLVTRLDRFRPEDLERLDLEGRITHASLVPAMMHQWLEERDGRSPPRSLRAVLVGGAPVPPALLERSLSSGVPVALTYGLTEAASQVATAPPALVRRKPGTTGPPLSGIRVRVEGGEIHLRGRSVMRGYLPPPGRGHGRVGDARETAEPPRDLSTRGGGPDGAAWLRTGDVGELDAEGHLWVRGRLGDRIVTGGVNVDPAEVEAALDGAPGVAELAVSSVPDPVWGERVVAVAVARSPAGLDPDALDRLARARLSSPRRPRAWIAAERLPRNANGKVDRAALRRLAELGSAATRGGAAPC